MIYIFILLTLISFSTNNLKADGKGNSIYLNPGVKLGYQFGENGGFVYGFEVSVTTYTKSSFPLPGVVFNIDRCKGKTKIHLGAQTSLMLGMELGPTLYIDNDKQYWGVSTTIFGFVFAIPYYEYTYLFDTNNLHQIGLFGKVPIPVKYGDNVYNIWD